MKKLEKLDVLMIVFVVIVCLFSLVVMHGWPEGEWALGWTSLAAIGGLAAGFGAFYAARAAIKIAEQQEQKENGLKRVEAEIASFSLATRLRLITNQLKTCLQKSKASELENLGSETAMLINLLDSLDDHDIRRLSYLNMQIAYKLAEAKSYFKGFYLKAYAGNGSLTRDVKARAFLEGANGGQVLDNYYNFFCDASEAMFKFNEAVYKKDQT